ncbi:Cell morphogenesis protein PAG1 [Lambiella insularis]|nr:Cell morphogenesis protein PAG1 [Lambiella insularis]
MAGLTQGKGWQHGAANSPDPHSQPHYNSPSYLDLRGTASSQASPSVRDPSATRGRLHGPANGASLALQTPGPLSSRALSPRIGNDEGPTRAGPMRSGGLERHPSNSYGHHRQTSIVHGMAQHSRNSSFANSPAMSHRSPQTANLYNGFASDNMVFESLCDDPPDFIPSASTSEFPTSTMHSQASTFLDDQDLLDEDVSMFTQRRIDRAPSAKARREHGRSQPKVHAEQISVGEYALQHLFNSFAGQAEGKINQCVAVSRDFEPRVEEVCGPGIDSEFDQLISALGHIARQKPKPLIDTIMFWRQHKGEAANKAQQEMHQAKLSPAQRTLPRRNTEPVHMLSPDSAPSQPGPDDLSNGLYASVDKWRQADQRLKISNYLLCRVLIEVYHQSDIKSIIPLGLEDRIFDQLTRLDPEKVSNSILLQSNWVIYGQLLGVMSVSHFQTISQRFVAELKNVSEETGSKAIISRETEGRASLVVLSMRYLSIRTQPENAWRESCDLIYALGKFFVSSHGQPIKHAYCKVLEALIFPVAASAITQLNSMRWKDFLSMLNTRLTQMLVKPRHWVEAFPLSTLLLCASSSDVFAGQWLPLITALPAKLKDKLTRSYALQAICRLVWTYLHRTPEGVAIIIRKLEDVLKIVLPSGKKTYITTDPAFMDPIIELIRIIGARFPEFCFRGIIFPLLNSEILASSRDAKHEQLEPERLVLGIKAFLAVVTELEMIERGGPRFPGFGIESGIPNHGKSSLIYHRPVVDDSNYYAPPEDLQPRPVMTTKLDLVSREYYVRFCEILGKITLICDNAVGGQAALDEKFGTQTPKTPIAESFAFTRKDEHPPGIDQKQGFYELLNVAIQALPRCLSNHIPFNALINLLCTGTAHVQSYIALSSSISLKAIAKESHAQPVTIGFARFIFNFDARYSTMSDEGLLGPVHIENTLKLYLELLQIWIEEIRHKTKTAASDSPQEGSSFTRGLHLDLTSIYALVEEVESHGLFFLCSQSRKVRSFAISVLRLVTEFDTALGQEHPRIIQILDGSLDRVIDTNDDRLTVAERIRLQKEKRKSSPQNTLIELCSSHGSYDSTLWFKLFPNLIRLSFERCPVTVTLGRDIVCARLLQMHNLISIFSEGNKGHQSTALNQVLNRLGTTPPEIVIEQWKLYLVMACTTLTNAGAQTQSQLANMQHMRNKSKSPQQGHEKISSARALFASVIPLLSAGPSSIRDAIVTALGSVNIKLYRTLLESLQYAVTTCNEEAKERVGHHHQRTESSSQRSRRIDRLRTEVTHVYRLTSHFLQKEDVLRDEWVIANLIKYTDDMRIFLSDTGIQNDWEFQTLRRHYCGLMEEVFEGVNRTKEPSRWMSFEARKAAFALMEDWCGYSPNQNEVSIREDSMRQSAINQQRDNGSRTNVTAAMEIEKRDLRIAALSAMSSLCAGPISLASERAFGLSQTFDIRRMLSWIDQIFSTMSDKSHLTGRRALTNLIVHNKSLSMLLEHALDMCCSCDKPKALESYFEVVVQVLTEHEDYPLSFWRVLGVVLITLGNEKSQVRTKSARLLRTMEQREQQRSSKLQDFDISISDKTTAVYKRAQFEISKRLANQYSHLAFLVFSHFSQHYKNVAPDAKRNMIEAILPWIQIIELQLNSNGRPTAQTYMLLANLLEITTKSSTALHNEIQALWQALATGPHGGNVQLILDFVISLCIDRREQSFVGYAKQIVVFLSSTPAGQKVVEFLLLQLTPKNMVYTERPNPMEISPDVSGLPYVADLGEALPIGNKQTGLSLGQLSLILLVDLIIAPVKLPRESVPLLLQVCIVLWDHYTVIVQEQAREMLVHLIHELVLSKIGDEDTSPTKEQIEGFVDSIRQSASKVVWSYHESGAMDSKATGNRVPTAMTHVCDQVIKFFSLAYPNIHEQWAKTTLTWATACSVRHLACRSFQIFRCILSTLDKGMLIDMLARLSNTIADESPEVQTFSMEILATLKTIIATLSPTEQLKYPQLFWVTHACLNTVNECEFIETLDILQTLLSKVDLSDPAVVRLLLEAKPEKWEGPFEGIMSLVYKGLRSETSLHKTLSVVITTMTLPDSELLGDQNRLLFALFAHLPCLLHTFDSDSRVSNQATVEAAKALANVTELEGYQDTTAVLNNFIHARYNSSEEFLAQILSTTRLSSFPALQFRCLVFLMGLLTNRLSWYKIKAMQILCSVIPDMDMRLPEFACHGPDLISPLLRLLQTEYCPRALEVMDNIMTVAATPMDKHHIRMSMASYGSRNIRKEYEKTQSLYGIPEETGWSIPAPALKANTTRLNVHAVFYTFAGENRMEAQPTATPEIEFDAEDFHQGSYFPLENGIAALPEESQIEYLFDSGASEAAVPDLEVDDSFEEDFMTTDDRIMSRYSDITVTGYGPDHDVADSYDLPTAAATHKTLAIQDSNNYLHNAFADLRGSPSDAAVMTPGAFTNGASPTPHVRQATHTRSVTSPHNSFLRSHGGDSTTDDEVGNFFSDDERSSGTSGTPVFETMRRSKTTIARRINPGRVHRENKPGDLLRGQSRARSKSQAPNSPEVPKVPLEYLAAMKSFESLRGS